MNVRDPFNRSRAFNIIRGTAIQTASRVVEASTQALDSGKKIVEEVVEDMSGYALPSNGSYSTVPREPDNRNWGGSGLTSRSSAPHSNGGMMGNVQDTVEGFFKEGKGDLPMYKDKPYAASRRHRPIWKQKKTWAGSGILTIMLLWFLGFFGTSSGDAPREKTTWSWLSRTEKSGSKINWNERREHVKDAFVLSWDAYERYAWGYDEFHPVSKKGRQMAPKGMGWIIVDALDTLMLMNLTSRLTHARDWISNTLTYDQDQEVNTFETTIRMLGGLLSAHYLSTTYPNMAPLLDDDEGSAGEDLYIEKAKDLADRLMGAFESKSGVPYASFNLQTSQGVPSHDDGGASSTAEAATLQLELKYLSKLTGETFYWNKAERVIQIIDDNGMEDGLLPIYIYADTGKFRGENIRLGSRGDSYYEYLIKQYLQTSKEEPIYQELWDEALAGVRKHLITYSTPSQFTVLGERQFGLKEELTPKMDHLVCFLPGTIALAATGGIPLKEARKQASWTKKKEEEITLARELTYTCWAMYKAMKTGLAPEIAYFHVDKQPPPESTKHQAPQTLDPEDHEWQKDFNIKPNDVHNLQRPETVETLFYMWRITGDEIYREWGWEMFKSFMNYTVVADNGGFTSLSNANTIPPVTKDNMESFWLVSNSSHYFKNSLIDLLDRLKH